MTKRQTDGQQVRETEKEIKKIYRTTEKMRKRREKLG